MALKKRNKVEATFSMSSMTDMIFLLLLFFMLAATMSSPNDMKVNLPQSRAKTATKTTIIKIGISENGEYSIAKQKEKSRPILFEELEMTLLNEKALDSTFYIAIYADENVPYKEIVKILDIANENKMKLVIATKSLEK